VLEKVDAAGRGEMNVEQDDVGPVYLNALEPGWPIVRRQHVHALRLESGSD
jgi:hypothetical protein